MEFNNELITTSEQENLNFNSSIRGSYSTLQFVIRLHKDVRHHLDQDGITPEKFQAFSTFLHETIHWWQHIGSHFGFILNTSYPSFAASSFEHLKTLISKDLAYKSLVKFEENYFNEKGVCDIEELNIIVNNFYDLDYAKLFCLDNKNIKDIVKDKRLFLSIGHCFMIMWSNSMFTISETLDKDFNFIPKFNDWIEKFQELESKKIEGFYPDSNYRVSPLGIKAIFEGQAIFNQIVYLKNAFAENKIIFKDFIDQGMLHGIYLEAFDLYLQIIKEDRPFFVDDALIGLFLLVCDISINPNNGFPLDIYDYENFINKNNPGLRFIKICEIISGQKGYYLESCKDLDKQSYIDLSKLLNKRLGCKCSYQTLEIFKTWANEESVKSLLKEEEKHVYEEINMPFRLFFAKYLRFQLDKFEQPEVFCWIGHHMSRAKDASIKHLFDKHRALFIDAEDGEVKPVIFDGIEEKNLLATFNKFYQHTMFYELILKWISEEGNFKFDYKWLLNERNEDAIPRIKQEFNRLFKIDIENIKIV